MPAEGHWATEVSEILRHLAVDPRIGLGSAETRARRRQHGLNRIREAQPKRMLPILLRQFRSLIVGLLILAAAAAFLTARWHEGIAVTIVVLINGVMGFIMELRAVRSMEALRALGSASTKVRRDGRLREVPTADLVPGDVVILEGGDLVPADLRLFESSKLQADESALTGESAPVGKRCCTVERETPLAERENMLFRGTALTRGSAEGVVVATGMATELGEIAALVEEAKEEQTPLEDRLDRLGGMLVWVTIATVILIAVTGVVAGKDVVLMIETGIALAVATVPEGLPIVATIALARGMWRMAQRNALVNRLAAVETLGATSVICTDKTGTLTENRMTVTCLVLMHEAVEVSESGAADPFIRAGAPVSVVEHSVLRDAVEVGVLCNNAELSTRSIGDPIEVALLALGKRAGISRRALVEKFPEVREVAFDSDEKMMATVHKGVGDYRFAVKGAPEAVLKSSVRMATGTGGDRALDGDERRRWLNENERLAAEGLRVLALATKRSVSPDDMAYENLIFLGLVAFLDPPRADVRDSIAACREAGIRVVMATGDQAGTARKVGEILGLLNEPGAGALLGDSLDGADALPEAEQRRLLETAIFARVSPRQKLDLIGLHQRNGSIVAMTGDGVNDAPALRKADIGVAMGQRGTQVAAEAADMVLRDDAFSTIVVAVRHGRIIFANIRQFVFYLLSCNLSEVLIVGLASLMNVPLPILPLQILFLNLVTDVFPALALGVGEGDPSVMSRSPRPASEPILGRREWTAIGGYALAITASVLGSLIFALAGLGMESQAAVTVSFLTLAFAQLWHVFNMPTAGAHPLHNEVVRNPWVWGALVLCVLLILAGAYVPALASVLEVSAPGWDGWLLILVASLIPLGSGWLLRTKFSVRSEVRSSWL